MARPDEETNTMLTLCLPGLANVAMEAMKKKFIVNFAKLLTNGLKFTRKTACLFLQQQPVKNILESSNYTLAMSFIKLWRSVPCKEVTA
jgi:hypothetical protein